MAFTMEDTLKEAADAIKDDVETDTAAASAVDDSSSIDVPSYLDTLDGDDNSPNTATAHQAASEVSDRFKYVADGVEYEASREEALRALSLARGARKAFSERSKLKRELTKLQDEAKTNGEFRKQWEAVMKDASTPNEVWERLTGHRWDDFLQSEMQRQQLYSKATPDERKLLDYESKFKEIDNRVKRAEEDSRARGAEAEKKILESGVQYMQSILVPELERYAAKISSKDPQSANRITKMIYRNTIADLKEFKQAGYSDEQLKNPAVLRKVLQRNADAVIREDKTKIEAAVAKEVDKKKAAAREGAQVAVTKDYPKTVAKASMKDLLKLDPLALFHNLR